MKINKEQIKKLKMFMVENDITFKEGDENFPLESRMFQDTPRIWVTKRGDLNIILRSTIRKYSEIDMSIKEFKIFYKDLCEYIGVKLQ